MGVVVLGIGYGLDEGIEEKIVIEIGVLFLLVEC